VRLTRTRECEALSRELSIQGGSEMKFSSIFISNTMKERTAAAAASISVSSLIALSSSSSVAAVAECVCVFVCSGECLYKKFIAQPST